MQFSQLINPIQADSAALELLLSEQLTSAIPVISDIGNHLVHSGGKRIRPAILLLMARGCGFDPQPGQSDHCRAAAALELIHSATLLHDDVIDTSMTRRGEPTAHTIWGNAKSVLVGDFLYSRAFQQLTLLDQAASVLPIIADSTTQIAEGEVLQLSHRHNPLLTRDIYQQIIVSKTAKLFEVAAHVGSVLANISEAHQLLAASYGLHLGLAFQLVDDLLDYSADAQQMGKDLGDDLAEGKMTLPMIIALEKGDEKTQTLIKSAILDGDRSKLSEIREAIISSGSVELTMDAAREAAHKACAALSFMPPSPYKNSLAALAEFAVSRSY